MMNKSQVDDRRWRGLVVLCAAAFMASLDLFIVNVAFEDIGRAFAEPSLANLSWVLNGYAIVYAALLVPAGRLADQWGRRAAFLSGLGLFTLASAGCAAAPSLWPLVGFRLVQAIGAAALTPASLGVLLASFPAAERPRAVRIWAASGALAAAAGPVVGGVLVEGSWRLVFLINIPVGLAAIVAGRRWLGESRDEHAAQLPDLPGAAVLAVSVALVSLGLVRAQEWGWGGVETLACFGAGAGGTVLLVRRSSRHPVPIVEPALVAVRSFAWANAAAFAFTAAFAANLLVTVLWLQRTWDYSALRTGLAVAPGPLMVPVLAAVADVVRRRVGSGGVVAAGCVLFGAGVATVATSVGGAPAYAAEVLPGLLLGGAGVGLALPEILSASTSDLPASRAATGSALVNASRQLGAVFGISLVVAVLGSPSSPSEALDAFRGAWWACVAAALVAAAVALGMTPSGSRRTVEEVGGDRLLAEGAA